MLAFRVKSFLAILKDLLSLEDIFKCFSLSTGLSVDIRVFYLVLISEYFRRCYYLPVSHPESLSTIPLYHTCFILFFLSLETWIGRIYFPRKDNNVGVS